MRRIGGQDGFGNDQVTLVGAVLPSVVVVLDHLRIRDLAHTHRFPGQPGAELREGRCWLERGRCTRDEVKRVCELNDNAQLLSCQRHRLRQRGRQRRGVAAGVNAIDHPALVPEQLHQAEVLVMPTVGAEQQGIDAGVEPQDLPGEIAEPPPARQPGYRPVVVEPRLQPQIVGVRQPRPQPAVGEGQEDLVKAGL